MPAMDAVGQVDLLAPVGGPADFGAIGESGVDGVIWPRPFPKHVQQWLNQLPTDALPSARAVFSATRIDRSVSAIVEASNMPAGEQRQWFIDDVAMITNAFARVMETPYLRLRFDVVSDDGCPKFHRDAVRARLLCAYRGLGTQYGVMNDDDEPERMFTAPTGAPIILRGTRWPSREGRALRHRSPPIAGSHTPRLVLALDPLTELPGDHGYDNLMV